MLPAITEE